MTETTTEADFWLYRDLDGKLRIGTDATVSLKILAGPRRASGWLAAREAFQEEIGLHVKHGERAPNDPAPVEPIFKSAHEALTFAFRFAGQQSPRTPMADMTQTEALGTGRGLSGLDGAAQAGMVKAALGALSDEQRHVLIARYGDIRRNCPCCGQPAPDQTWVEAVEALSQCDELRDLPKLVRTRLIEMAVCRRRGKVSDVARESGYSAITVRRRYRDAKERYGKVENNAIGWLEQFFAGRGLLKLTD